jgi:hypothetical protein
MDSVIRKFCTVDLDADYIIRAGISSLEYLHHIYEPKIYARFCKYAGRGYNIYISNHQKNTQLLARRIKIDPDDLYDDYNLIPSSDSNMVQKEAAALILAHEWICFWQERLVNNFKVLPYREPSWK